MKGIASNSNCFFRLLGTILASTNVCQQNEALRLRPVDLTCLDKEIKQVKFIN